MSRPAEYARSAALILCFVTAAVSLHVQQWLGYPLKWIDSTWAEAWQNYIKASTAVLMIGLNQWRAPITAYMYGDASVRGQIRRGADGKVICDFPNRMILVANHQIYTDWVALWWSAYTANYHGHFFVVLKDAIQKIPVIGAGLGFFNWIFLSRRWEADQQRLQRHIDQLSDSSKKTPMWLVIFPEGTNLSKRSAAISNKWAEQNGIKPLELTLLPRARGLHACLSELVDTVDWLYDCAIAYEGIPPGMEGQEIFNLKTLYIDGRKAPVTHIHWRRFATKDIPWQEFEPFEKWLIDRWVEKEQLLKQFHKTGRFPSDDGYVQSNIELSTPFAFSRVAYSLLAPLTLWWLWRFVYSIANSFFSAKA